MKVSGCCKVILGSGADVPVKVSCCCTVIVGSGGDVPVKVSGCCKLILGSGGDVPGNSRGCVVRDNWFTITGVASGTGAIRGVAEGGLTGCAAGAAVGAVGAVGAGVCIVGTGSNVEASARQLPAVNAKPNTSPRWRQANGSVESWICCFIAINVSNLWATKNTQWNQRCSKPTGLDFVGIARQPLGMKQNFAVESIAFSVCHRRQNSSACLRPATP